MAEIKTKEQILDNSPMIFSSGNGCAINVFKDDILAAMSSWEQQQTSLLRERVKECEGLLRDIMNYHLGNGKYNFSNLPEDQRSNEAFDAWMELKAKIEKSLLTPEENK